MKPHLLLPTFLLALILFACSNNPEKAATYDICVYGDASAAVIAAYAAKMRGKSVLLISPDRHLGGLSASGLGATDIGNKYAVTGLGRDFYRRLGKIYDRFESWTFEPHRAEQVFQDYIREAGVEVWYEYRLAGLEKEGTEIRSITVENAADPSAPKRSVAARQFIDASYVGDLLARAGVSYTVGREANDAYGETLNGVQHQDKHQFPPNDKEPYYIDPYRIEGDPASGLCWGISPEPLSPNGTGDNKVQTYNYRLCITQNVDNQVPFSRPATYDSTRYELLRRLIQKRHEAGMEHPLDRFYLSIIGMPNGKTDVNNNGPLSTDFIGMNYRYPEAGYDRRRQIEQEHEEYIRGLLYFLSHDSRLPEGIRKEMSSWGWAKDEFVDNDYFPYKMYIREARRMVGEYVMTEHNCVGKTVAEDPIGLAAYTMDSHNCQRVVVFRDGKAMVQNEGDVQVGGFPPYPISYRSLTPKREECTNLLAPVCLSATHIAYGSIRMEPVFMVLGEVAALAASLAIDQGASVQEIDVAKLQTILADDPLLDGPPADVLIDNADSARVKPAGAWTLNRVWMGQYKTDCLFADNTAANTSIAFRLPVARAGRYRLYYYVPAPPYVEDATTEWVETLPLTLRQGKAITSLTADIRANKHDWAYLGALDLPAGQELSLEIKTTGSAGYVPADAVLLVPERKE